MKEKIPRFVKVINNEPSSLLQRLQQPFFQKIEDEINKNIKNRIDKEINKLIKNKK